MCVPATQQWRFWTFVNVTFENSDKLVEFRELAKKSDILHEVLDILEIITSTFLLHINNIFWQTVTFYVTQIACYWAYSDLESVYKNPIILTDVVKYIWCLGIHFSICLKAIWRGQEFMRLMSHRSVTCACTKRTSKRPFPWFPDSELTTNLTLSLPNNHVHIHLPTNYTHLCAIPNTH